MTIRIVITGGTIDKEYNPLNGELIFTKSHLPEILKQANNTLKIKMQTIFLKDSLEITPVDRKKIILACEAAKEKLIVITHGTDTMTDTALALAKASKNKVIVLTGAMIPYSFNNSDALFNLGCAITAVQCLEPGVYITMNGQIFSANNVKKNTDLGQFHAIK